MVDITGVLLAAGASRRFGTHKLLAELNDRILPLLAAQALSVCDRVLAVVRPDDSVLMYHLNKAGIDTVINDAATRGIGNSIACGVSASRDSNGWCILPADMPQVQISTTAGILVALRAGALLAAPFYNGQRGHPVGFAREFAEALMALDGDVGARHIIEQYQEHLVRIDTSDPGILIDIDTPEDLYNARAGPDDSE